MRSLATATFVFALCVWPASDGLAQERLRPERGAEPPGESAWGSGPTPNEKAATPAQMNASSMHELVLVDGSRLYGIVEKQGDDEIVFRTHSGSVVTVARSQVRSLKLVEGTVEKGEFVRADPNATRLFFGPTGRSLPKGQVYLGMYEFLMPVLQVGVTDRLSIGGGTPLIFGLEDWERPFWVTPKFQVLNTAGTQAAVGVLHAFDTDGDGGGIAYGVVTRGNALGSFTGGAGLAYSTLGERGWVIMLGGERTMRRNIRFVTENYYWKGGNGALSAGLRFFGEKLAADLAIVVPLVDDPFAFPVLNFVYVF